MRCYFEAPEICNEKFKLQERGGGKKGKSSHSFGPAYISGLVIQRFLLCVFVIWTLINILENCFDIPKLSLRLVRVKRKGGK